MKSPIAAPRRDVPDAALSTRAADVRGGLSYADGWAERWDIFGGSVRQQRKTPWENTLLSWLVVWNINDV